MGLVNRAGFAIARAAHRQWDRLALPIKRQSLKFLVNPAIIRLDPLFVLSRFYQKEKSHLQIFVSGWLSMWRISESNRWPLACHDVFWQIQIDSNTRKLFIYQLVTKKYFSFYFINSSIFPTLVLPKYYLKILGAKMESDGSIKKSGALDL